MGSTGGDHVVVAADAAATARHVRSLAQSVNVLLEQAAPLVTALCDSTRWSGAGAERFRSTARPTLARAQSASRAVQGTTASALTAIQAIDTADEANGVTSGGGGSGGNGVAAAVAPTLVTVGGVTIAEFTKGGKTYRFRVGQRSDSQTEQEVMDYLNKDLKNSGRLYDGSATGSGDIYVPLNSKANSKFGSSPDMLRIEYRNGQVVDITRVDIFSPEPGTDSSGIYSTINGKQGRQADEIVIDMRNTPAGAREPLIQEVTASIHDVRANGVMKGLDGVRYTDLSGFDTTIVKGDAVIPTRPALAGGRGSAVVSEGAVATAGVEGAIDNQNEAEVQLEMELAEDAE
jgi:hypothetical protein